MSWLRNLMLLNWFNRSRGAWLPWIALKKTARAKRNEAGEPICGDCMMVVPEEATKCAGCGSQLYTFRGRLGRRLGFLFALMFLVQAGLGPESSMGLGLLPSLVVGPIGLVLLYLSIRWYLDRPVRELNVREQFPV